MGPTGSLVSLSIPAQGDEISTVRSFAYAVGRHAGLDDETIEDLKLALSEIAADGIETGGSAIRVAVEGQPPGVTISVEVPGGGSSSTDPVVDRAQIVRALFPSVRAEHRGDAVVTTFSVGEG